MLIVSISGNHREWTSTIVSSNEQQNGCSEEEEEWEEKWPEMCNGNTGFQKEYKTKHSTFHHFEMLLLES